MSDHTTQALIRWACARAGIPAGQAPTTVQMPAVGKALAELALAVERVRAAAAAAKKRGPGRPPKSNLSTGAGTAALLRIPFPAARSQGRKRLKQTSGRPMANDEDALRIAIGFLIAYPGRSRTWAADRAALFMCGRDAFAKFGPIRATPASSSDYRAKALSLRLARKLAKIALV